MRIVNVSKTATIKNTKILKKNIPFQVLGILLTSLTTLACGQKTPYFYGWFFDETVATGLKEITDEYLAKLYENVGDVQAYLKNVSASAAIENPLQYYKKPVDPNTGDYDKFFHITSFYCGTDDCSNYSRQVAEHLNQTFVTHLVGVFFTPRTYGIRVNLTTDQKVIFDITNDTSRTLQLNDETCEAPLVNGIQFCPQNDTNLQPTDTRAHVTLGCAPNISAVTTGLDLIEILELEMSPSQFCAINQVDDGTLIRMGEKCDIFVLYLKEKMVANSTFEVYYSNSVSLVASVPCVVIYFMLQFLLFAFGKTLSSSV